MKVKIDLLLFTIDLLLGMRVRWFCALVISQHCA
jgi:hypothetical protein